MSGDRPLIPEALTGCELRHWSDRKGDNMKRSGALFAALVILSVWIGGCSSAPTPDQIAIKQAFIRQLIGSCAEVNRQLANIDAKAQPGIHADEYAQFADEARRQPAPDLDREQFEIMLTKIDTTVGQYRRAEAALTTGDQSKADAALAQADRQLKSADAAAQKYGMPPLNSCPQHESRTSPPAPDPSAAPAPAAGWRPLHEAAVAVQQVNATVLNGRIWVAGGLTPSHEPTASTQFYDPAINSWGLGPSLPEPVHHAMLVTYRNQLVVIGGFHSRDNDPLAVTSSRMLLLDNNTGKWVDGPRLNLARAGAGAAVVDDKIVVVGGRTGNPAQLVTQTEVYDGTRWSVRAAILSPGDHLAVTADSRYLYAVGGRKFTADTNTDVVQRYDPKADHWIALTPTRQPHSGAGAAIVDGRLIVVGGEGVTTVSATVQAYDLTASTATWTALPSLTPEGRHGLGVTAIGNTLYAVGGATKAGHTASTNLVAALTFS
jgi:N-acetylneuraminic acid mutarotase